MSRIANVIFATLTIIILGNLNGVVYLFFQKVAFFSYIILVLCVLLLFYIFKFRLPKANFPERLLIVFFIIFFGFSSIATIFYKQYSAEYLQLMVSYFSSILIIYVYYKFLIISYASGKANDSINFITLILFISCLLIVVVDATGLQEFGQYSAGTERSSGLFANPNEAGVQANLALVFTINFWIRQKGWFKSLLVSLAILLEVYASVITFSKGAILLSLGILVLFALLYIFRRKRDQVFLVRKNINYIGILILVTGLFIYNNSQNQFYDQLTIEQQKRIDEVGELLSGELNDQTTSHRLMTSTAGLELINQNPFTGYGLGVFQRLPNLGKGVHNTYLMIWGEAGILAIMVFIFFIISSFYYALIIKSFNTKFLAFGVILVFALAGLASHNLLDDRNMNAFLGTFLAILRMR